MGVCTGLDSQEQSLEDSDPTDVLIQTYNAMMDYSAFSHYSLIQEPQGRGMEQITMTTGCANTFGCEVRVNVARRSLYEFVTDQPVLVNTQ